MPKLTIASLPEKLLTLTHAVDLCDAQGHVVGRYTPTGRFAGMEPKVSDDELDRRERQGGGRTLAEIVADLEKRP